MIKLDGKQDCATDERAVPEGVDTQKGKAIADYLYQYSPMMAPSAAINAEKV